MRSAEGLLSAVSISLNARNVAIDTDGHRRVAGGRGIASIFVGSAAINEARLDIEDLVIMSGSAGIRVKGAITGGGESAGLRLSGRMRDLSANCSSGCGRPSWSPRHVTG